MCNDIGLEGEENCYDGEKLRVGLKENGKVSTFVFKGEILAECDGNGVLTKRHVQGLGLSYVQTMDDEAYHAYYHDEQGSTAYVTGNSGEWRTIIPMMHSEIYLRRRKIYEAVFCIRVSSMIRRQNSII